MEESFRRKGDFCWHCHTGIYTYPIRVALEKKIDYLTLFAFSTENWLREEVEVKDLISLFFEALEDQTPELREQKVKLNFIGDISRFNKKLIKQIEKSKKITNEYDP